MSIFWLVANLLSLIAKDIKQTSVLVSFSMFPDLYMQRFQCICKRIELDLVHCADTYWTSTPNCITNTQRIVNLLNSWPLFLCGSFPLFVWKFQASPNLFTQVMRPRIHPWIINTVVTIRVKRTIETIWALHVSFNTYGGVRFIFFLIFGSWHFNHHCTQACA